MATSQKNLGQYTKPQVRVLTEQEVLEVFQITTAGMSGWWMQ